MTDEFEALRNLRRGPWTRDVNRVANDTDNNPDEPNTVAQDLHPPPWFSSLWIAGFQNHNMQDDPPDPTTDINNYDNKLPGYEITQSSGTAITAQWETDSGAGSGAVLRFTVAAGAAGDDTYVEQIVPIGATRGQTFAYLPGGRFENPSASNDLECYVTSQFLDADGNTTGAADTEFILFSGTFLDLITGPADGGGPPSDAAAVRTRWGVRRGAAANGVTGTVDLCEVFLLKGPPITVVAEIEDVASFDPGRIQQQQGIIYISSGSGELAFGNGEFALAPITPPMGTLPFNLDTTLPGAATSNPGYAGSPVIRYVPPWDGYIYAISIRLSAARATGTLTARAAINATPSGPTATINGTDTQSAYAVDTTPSSNTFAAGDLITVDLTGAGFTPTANDASVTVHVVYLT